MGMCENRHALSDWVRNMQAIDLFGGEETLRQVMTEAVCTQIGKISPKTRTCLELSLHLDRGTLTSLKKGRVEVDMRLFEKLAPCLGLSLFEVFGDPKWTTQAKKFWNVEMEKHPMVGAAFSNSGLPTVKKIPPGMYVTFRAVQELRARLKSE